MQNVLCANYNGTFLSRRCRPPRLNEENLLFLCSLNSKQNILQMLRCSVCLSLFLPLSWSDVSFLSYKLLLLCFPGAGGGGWEGTSAMLGSCFFSDGSGVFEVGTTQGRKEIHIFLKQVSVNTSELQFVGKFRFCSWQKTPSFRTFEANSTHCTIVSAATLCRPVFPASTCYVMMYN